MKLLFKLLLLSILFLGLSIGGYWLIFSQGLILGILFSGVILILCVGMLAFSLYGIETGGLRKIGLTSRMEVAAMLILTVYLSSAIGVFAVANTALEARELTKDFSASEKTEMLVASLWNSGPKNNAAGSLEKNGVVYSYTSATEDEIQKIDEFLELEKQRIDDFFGNEEPGNLTIVFHDDFETLSQASGYEEAMGYYDYYSREIHLVPDDYSWDIILLHEYAHHQSHLYSEKAGLSETRLPVWFEEGIADYLAGETSDWYDLEDIEITDFTLLDTDASFHESYSRNFDPYVQSFLAVESLANDYGEGILATLLSADKKSEFYGMLQEASGMELADFQETFLDELIAESQAEMAHYDAVYAAMDKGDFAGSLSLIDELKKDASEEDLYHLSWMETDIYLMENRFDDAIRLIEGRLETGDADSRVDDLTSLAEIYLLVDPAKSLALIRDAQIVVDDSSEDLDMGFTFYDLEAYGEAYELINSSSPLEGYMILLDEELLYYDAVIEKVTELVENEIQEAG